MNRKQDINIRKIVKAIISVVTPILVFFAAKNLISNHVVSLVIRCMCVVILFLLLIKNGGGE